MVVIADTSPLNYLILIGATELLPVLYGSIHLAPACMAELTSAEAPGAVREWLVTRPTWLHVTSPAGPCDARLSHLDTGEREALSLALELKADLVLIDERDGRKAAQACGLRIAGTLRVLADGASAGAIDLEQAFQRLRSTSFRADPALMEAILKRARNR
jgi:predicted nucleic acid-binding protein